MTKRKCTGMYTWTDVCNVRKGPRSLRQCKIHPNKDHLGSKDRNKQGIYRQCFAKFGRQEQADSIIENEFILRPSS